MNHIVKITSIKFINHDVLEIVTEKPKGITYKPGQAVDVSIHKEGWEEEIRPFTFVSLEEEDHLKFNIKSYNDHAGVTYKLASLKENDELIIGEVFGAIRYKGEGMFLAGGAGITPFLAIFNWLKRENKIGHNKLIFANKTEKDIFHKEFFHELFGNGFINILSNEKNEHYKHGFIDAEFINKNKDENIEYYYICGPDPMMDAVQKALKKLGVSEEKIITEDFS